MAIKTPTRPTTDGAGPNPERHGGAPFEWPHLVIPSTAHQIGQDVPLPGNDHGGFTVAKAFVVTGEVAAIGATGATVAEAVDVAVTGNGFMGPQIDGAFRRLLRQDQSTDNHQTPPAATPGIGSPTPGAETPTPVPTVEGPTNVSEQYQSILLTPWQNVLTHEIGMQSAHLTAWEMPGNVLQIRDGNVVIATFDNNGFHFVANAEAGHHDEGAKLGARLMQDANANRGNQPEYVLNPVTVPEGAKVASTTEQYTFTDPSTGATHTVYVIVYSWDKQSTNMQTIDVFSSQYNGSNINVGSNSNPYIRRYAPNINENMHTTPINNTEVGYFFTLGSNATDTNARHQGDAMFTGVTGNQAVATGTDHQIQPFSISLNGQSYSVDLVSPTA